MSSQPPPPPLDEALRRQEDELDALLEASVQLSQILQATTRLLEASRRTQAERRQGLARHRQDWPGAMVQLENRLMEQEAVAQARLSEVARRTEERVAELAEAFSEQQRIFLALQAEARAAPPGES